MYFYLYTIYLYFNYYYLDFGNILKYLNFIYQLIIIKLNCKVGALTFQAQGKFCVCWTWLGRYATTNDETYSYCAMSWFKKSRQLCYHNDRTDIVALQRAQFDLTVVPHLGVLSWWSFIYFILFASKSPAFVKSQTRIVSILSTVTSYFAAKIAPKLQHNNRTVT